MAQLRLAVSVRAALAAALVEEPAFIEALRPTRPVAVPGEPGRFRVDFSLAVPRPQDPEFIEVRPVVVWMRQATDAFEIERIDGLES